MKKMIQLLILSSCIYLQSYSQAGVYLSASDYNNHQIQHKIDCHTGTIKLHRFMRSNPYLSIIEGDETQKFYAKDIYGYTDCERHTFRLFNNKEYFIAEAGDIFIYMQKEYVAEYHKKNHAVYTYYFSVGAESDIMELNISNLKKVYSDNTKFIELLDLYFQNGVVTEYDDIHKMYKLNYVYDLSLK